MPLPPCLAVTLSVLLTAVLAAAAVRAETVTPPVVDGRELALPLPHGVDDDARPAVPARAAAAAEDAFATALPVARGSWVARVLGGLPVTLRGRDAVFAPAGWSLRVGRGAMASVGAGRVDLSPTRAVTAAALTRARGDVALVRDGPSVGDVFARFGGLGHRLRARVDLRGPALGGGSAAAAVSRDGDVDLAVAHATRLGGWRGATRFAAAADHLADRRALQLESSAAARHPRTGWDITLAAAGRHDRGTPGAPVTLYAKVGRSADPAAPIAGAWALDAAVARDVRRAGDRAWLAGASWLQRLKGVGRLHVRYRYQRLEAADDVDGGAHAVTIGAKLKL